MRVDFNVPMIDGKISDSTRISAAMPSIKAILDRGASLILMSHLGRPRGKKELRYSLKPVADYLSSNQPFPVYFTADCLGTEAEKAAEALKSGEMLLLENTRFHSGEKENSPEMAKALADLADIFVSDAFGSAHRAHASTVGVTEHLPSVAGMLMEKEIQYLGNLLADPERPFVAILGGAKISDKISVIENLLSIADSLLIGGGMANTFLKAQGNDMADSLVDDSSLEIARNHLARAGKKIVLPIDLKIADRFSEDARSKIVSPEDIPEAWQALDIGPKSIALFADKINKAKTVIWNGPMGVFEFPAFSMGTFALAKALAESDAISIVGGGDSAAAIKQSGLSDSVSHVSTGGGASLEMLAGKKLPGLEALDDKE